MRTILLALILMINMNANAQKTYRATKDTVDGGQIFNGKITIEDLKQEPSFTWMKSDAYEPNEKAMSLLRFYLRQYSIVVFMGTWCDDSHNIIPKFAKVLSILKYPADKIAMYGVDRDKATLSGIQKKYGITNVPTIILFKGDEEAGRITETVKTTVEGDMSAIIQTEMAGQQPRQ